MKVKVKGDCFDCKYSESDGYYGDSFCVKMIEENGEEGEWKCPFDFEYEKSEDL